MDVTRALSIAQEELQDYNLEGECLSLYDGSDFITLFLAGHEASQLYK